MLGNNIERLGSFILSLIESLGEILVFLYKSITASFSSPVNFRLVLEQIDEIGFKSIPIVIASAMAIGMVMEIGSMKVTEQIDAIRTMGADPMKKLVAPRLLAAIISFPFLAMIADFSGIFGAMIMSNIDLDVQPRLFISSILEWVAIDDFISGIAKTFFFGIIVAITGCYIGMKAEGGTQGVGRATTETVVVALLLIIIGDFILTKIFLLL